MSLERVLKTLEDFGLSRLESQVYIYLAKAGPSKAKDLSRGLGIAQQQIYPALKSLGKKRLVNSRSERVALFSALAFEELLDRYVKSSDELAKALKETKQELGASRQGMTTKKNS